MGLVSETYPRWLKCVHHEDGPAQPLVGRGTHASIVEAKQRLLTKGPGYRPSSPGLWLRFALVWDEDHDTRIFEVLGRLQQSNLLWPIVCIGERKGGLYMLVDNEAPVGEYYENAVASLCENVGGDVWCLGIGTVVLGPPFQVVTGTGLINDSQERVEAYLHELHQEWHLGNRYY